MLPDTMTVREFEKLQARGLATMEINDGGVLNATARVKKI